MYKHLYGDVMYKNKKIYKVSQVSLAMITAFVIINVITEWNILLTLTKKTYSIVWTFFKDQLK